jgi:hypothetical protein
VKGHVWIVERAFAAFTPFFAELHAKRHFTVSDRVTDTVSDCRQIITELSRQGLFAEWPHMNASDWARCLDTMLQ